MNKLYSTILKGAWLRSLMVMMAMFTVSALSAQAPVKITRFYPDKAAETQELRASKTVFIFLQNLTGEDICATRMDMRLLQNGEVIGDGDMKSDRLGDMVPNGTTGLGFRVEDCKAVFGKMQPGLVTLQVYGVTYTDASGVEHHWVDTENDLDEVTYVVKSSAFVESSEGIAKNIFRSYFPPEEENGLLKVHISVPIRAEGIHAYLEYGTANNSATTFVEPYLSQDRKTLLIDFRGVARPSSVLAHGKTFTDDDGNVVIPTTVTLNISGMTADDGAIVESTFTNPTTGQKVSYSGAFFAFEYVDDSFPNPVLREAKFFDSADPETTYNNILPTTDKMVVKVEHAEYIKYADMVVTCGEEVSETYAYDQIEKGEGTYTVTLTEPILRAGSTNMIIALENVEFTEFDGVDHKIEPLDLAGAVTEVFSLDEAKALEIGTDFVLNSQDLTITFSKGGYVFMEDQSAGVRLIGEDANSLEIGTRLFGKFAGSNQGGNAINYNAAKSSLTTGTSNITSGLVLYEEKDLLDDYFQCRYVTAAISDDLTVQVADGMLMLGQSVVGVLDLYEGEVPEKIESVTGVLYQLSGTKLMIVTDFNTLRKGDDLPEFATFAELVAAAPEGEVLLDLNNAVVTFTSFYGDFYIQDETAGICMAELNDGEAPQRGTALTGQVKGYYLASNRAFLYNAEDLNATTEEVNVTFGQRVTGDEILTGDYNYRLVTVYFEDQPIVRDADNFGAVIAAENPVYVVDFFDVIEDWNWRFPMGSKSVTGIVYPLEAMPMKAKANANADDDDFPTVGVADDTTIFLAIRDEADVVALDTLNSLKEVRESAQSGETYIVNLNDTKITYAIDDEVLVAEDATAAVLFYSDGEEFPIGTEINGQMIAIYDSYTGLITCPELCEFELSEADVTTGVEMTDQEILDPMNDLRLVTLTKADHSFEFVEDGAYFVDDQILAALLEYDVETPENVKQITGIIFREYASEDEKEFGEAVIIIRTPEDIVADSDPSGVESINPDAATSNSGVYNLQGIQVRKNSSDLKGLKGVYIVNGQKVLIK